MLSPRICALRVLRQPVEGGRCVAFQHIRAGSAEVGEVCPERSALVIIQPVGMAIEFSGPRRREREFPVEAEFDHIFHRVTLPCYVSRWAAWSAIIVTLRERVKYALGNILLVAASITICYAVAELAFFRFMLPYMSLNLLPHLPDRAAYFLQSSKSHFVPSDYIALVGDSNAQGMGDWLFANGGDQSKPHHSANVLHDQLGVDVVSVGRAASGSAEAMVLRVTRVYDDSYCYLFPHIADPKRMLIYFYEGNDLDDNYKLLDHRVRPDGGDLRPQID